MNRLGIQSLNAGAPDLRLSGDQTQRGTYTQRRRDQMAYGGIAGLDGRKAYGIGSWFQKAKDKVVDDFIPNEIKENPLLTAALVGGGINQFGIPGMDQAGQGWINDLLGGAGDMIRTGAGNVKDFLTPGTFPDYSNVTGVFRPGQTAEKGGNPLRSLLDVTGVFRPGQTAEKGGNPLSPVEFAKQQGLNLLGNQLGLNTGKSFVDTLFGDTERDGQPAFNWKIPVAGGLAAGAYAASQPRDTLPMDETGINFQTAEEAMADPNLRFKPEAQYANVAEGGRIGYEDGKSVIDTESAEYKSWKNLYTSGNIDMAKQYHPNHEAYKQQLESKAQGGRIGYQDAGDVEIPEVNTEDILKKLENFRKKRQDYEDAIFRSKRIDAQEGGLMDLGGMEKDYRQEGGFVPIGGQEKADDVPARLSKNEFVFTADAVRAAGEGDIDKGASVMENLMEHLEAGGEISEDSQGLEGAQKMYANTQRLQNRII
jgi:hypothetical protein